MSIRKSLNKEDENNNEDHPDSDNVTNTNIGSYHTKQEVMYKARFCNNYCIIYIEQWGSRKI